MKYRPRIYYTETDKALMWDRWQKGDSLHAIARLFDRGHGSIARILSTTGGIRPPKRTRSRRALSLAEREEISRGVVAGHSLRSIAESLRRAPSTVSREINRKRCPATLPSQQSRSSSLGADLNNHQPEPKGGGHDARSNTGYTASLNRLATNADEKCWLARRCVPTRLGKFVQNTFVTFTIVGH